MAAHSGTAGSVVLIIGGTASVDQLNQWTANFAMETTEYQKFGSTWKQRVIGAGDITGTFRGQWDMTDTAGQLKLKNSMLGGSVVGLKLYDTAATYWAGSAYINSGGQTTPQSGMVTADFGFVGDGSAWTYT